MGRQLDDISKAIKAAKVLQDILTEPKTSQAFERMSTSIEHLSSQLSGLNAAMLEQNKQISTSIGQAKQQAIELRNELEKLNEASGKSHTLFERLEKASKTTEDLNRIVASFTIIAAAVGLYSIYKDIFCIANTSCNYAQIATGAIFSAIIVLVVMWWILETKIYASIKNSLMKLSGLAKDYLPFLIFSIIIALLFFTVPMDLQNRLAFNPQNPAWFTLFTASFFHNDFDHLMSNIIGYLIGSFALFLALRYQSDTKSLFFLILACVLIVPFVSSITVYFLTPTIPPARGFSDVVFSIVGLFPAATLMFMKSRSWIVYIIAWLMLEVTAYFYVLSQFVGVLILLLAYLFLFSFWGWKTKFFSKERLAKQIGVLYALIITPFILLLLGFPAVFVVNGSLVNVMAHYMGFQVGAAVGAIYLYRDYVSKTLSSFVATIRCLLNLRA